MSAGRLALYTTVYPGVESYLAAWGQSVRAQEDTNWDLWIGVDSLDIDSVARAIDMPRPPTWVEARAGSSPAQLRQQALAQIVEQYSAVVLVDSDDILYPTRVAAARSWMETSQLNGCALDLVDQQGHRLGLTFPPSIADAAALLPRGNLFGMSNTIYCSDLLRRCLPIPADCVLVDWFLATRAWALGAGLSFDFHARMAYRQHPRNIGRILAPFTSEQVRLCTRLVLQHYALLLDGTADLPEPYRDELSVARASVYAFHLSIEESPAILGRYTQTINQQPLLRFWWEHVARPDLEGIWKS